MSAVIERMAFIGVLGALCIMLINEGRTQVRLERQIPVQSKVLYDQMASGKRLQIIDIRPLTDDEDDDVGGYEDARVPKSIPFPGCDEGITPNDALLNIKFGVPTVIISLDGDIKRLEGCAMFARMRNLEGGMVAWSEEGFPEDEGEYVAPKMGGGGGCL